MGKFVQLSGPVHALLLQLLLVLSAGATAGNAAEGPTVDLSAIPAEVAVGDPVTVTVTYSWPKGWLVEKIPDPGEDFHATFVTDAPPPQETATAEGVRRVVRLTIAATRSGAWALPRPAFTASGPTGPVTAQAPVVVVQVGTEASPPKLPEALPLRIRPPFVAQSAARWWWLAGVAGALILVIGWLVRRRAAAVESLPPAMIFGREIEQLATVRDPRELSAGLSMAVRRYMAAIWSFDALGSTVREIAARQSGITSSGERFQDLVRVLQQLDDVRWSAGDLTREQVTLHLSAATTLVAQIEAERVLAAAAAAGVNGSAPGNPSGGSSSSSSLTSSSSTGGSRSTSGSSASGRAPSGTTSGSAGAP